MAAPFFSEDYTYFKAGNLKQLKSTAASGRKVLRYTYDPLYQLTKVEKKNGTTFDTLESYAYDAHGNRTSKGTTTFENNSADQLLSAGTTDVTYDSNGNHEKIAKPSSERTYTFDYADLPTKIKEGSTTVASYTYDGDKKRVARETAAGDNLRYLWAGTDVLKEYNSDDSVKAEYLLGLGREAIKVDGQWHFYITDHLGSTRYLANTAGNLSASYDYDSFGNETTSGQTIYNPFRYTGQQWDAHEAHLYLRNRYYQPDLGRFLVRDPIRYQGGTNLYAYCGNNPICGVDPAGLNPIIPDPNQANIPGGPWTSAGAGQRPGAFLGPKGVKGLRMQCEYVPPGGPSGSIGYFKTKWNNVKNEWQRYDLEGNPVTPEEAHPGSMPLYKSPETELLETIQSPEPPLPDLSMPEVPVFDEVIPEPYIFDIFFP
jgi:RHS repeat-associated protein